MRLLARPTAVVKLQLELSLDFRANSGDRFIPVRSGPVRLSAARDRHRPDRFLPSDKKLLSDCAFGTGLVLGERFRALIGFVWPARNGTASDTAAARSDGTGSVPEPVPKLLIYPPPPRLPPSFSVRSPFCPDFRS